MPEIIVYPFKTKYSCTMKKIFFTISLLLTVISVMAQNAKIKLHFEGLASKSVAVEFVSDKPVPVFSGMTDEKGDLTIAADLPEYGFYKFVIDNKKETFFLVAGPGDKITLTSNMNGLIKNMKVDGSPENARYLKVKVQSDSLRGVQSRLENEHKQLSVVPGNEARLGEIVLEYNNLQMERTGIIKKYMEDNYQSLTVLFFAEDVKQEDEPILYDKIAEALVKKYPNNYFVKDLIRKVAVEKVTRIGALAPDIALPTPAGDTIRLSSLRGKVVLLDFWAAWCGPCRRENPNMLKIYEQYKDQGFEIYGVSLDRDRASWLKGIEEDRLPWILVSDLKYWQCAPAQVYGVTSIPHAVLIDREGHIVAKKVRSHDLEKILPEIFAKEEQQKSQDK